MLGLAKPGVAQVLLAVDGLVELGEDGSKGLVDELVDALVAADCFFKMDDKAGRVGQLLAERIADRFFFHKKYPTTELQFPTLLQCLAGGNVIAVGAILFAPLIEYLQRCRDMFVEQRPGRVFVVVDKCLDQVAFLVVLAAGQFGQVFTRIEVVEIVAVLGDHATEGFQCSFLPVGDAFHSPMIGEEAKKRIMVGQAERQHEKRVAVVVAEKGDHISGQEGEPIPVLVAEQIEVGKGELGDPVR